MKQPRAKDSEKSRADILKAAEMEFSEKGLYGARIDKIAARADINKRMIYEYFGGKEGLYKSVLIEVYNRLSKKEIDVLSTDVPCTEAIRNIIELYFDFLSNNPTYVNLILWENLNKGIYIQNIDFTGIKDPAFEMLRNIIKKGKEEGTFSKDVDSDQIIISLLTITFAYFSNRYTLSKLLGRKLDDETNIRSRVDTVVDMFLGYLSNKK